MHRHAEFGRQHDILAPIAEALAQVFLGAPALPVDVGGVEQRDAEIERAVHELARCRKVEPSAEIVAAQADQRDERRVVLDRELPLAARAAQLATFVNGSDQRDLVATSMKLADVGELVFLPPLRAHLERAAPGADIKTVSTPPAELEEAMRAGEVDLAVGYFPGLQGAAIYQQRLFSHSFVCIVRKNHPRIGEQITKKQFLQEKHAVVQQEGKSHELFELALAEQGLSRRIALSVPHFLAIPLIIAESDLVVTVPYAVARSFATPVGAG